MLKLDWESIILKYVRLVSLTDISKLLLALVLLVEAINPAFGTIRTRAQVHVHTCIQTP